MGRARRRRERVLEHLTELRRLPIGGAPEPSFRARLRAELLAPARHAGGPCCPIWPRSGWRRP
jgi:hypothetical protein